jgi:uncharacterized integral membrane protein
MIRFISLLVTIPVILVIAAFTYRNAQLVRIDFFTSEFQIPLAVIVFVAMFIGGALGFVLNLYIIIKQKNKMRQIEKQRQALAGLSDVLKIDK